MADVDSKTAANKDAGGLTDERGFLDYDGAHLTRFIDAFSAQHVVCVGDLMLDIFVYGETKRISPEAPVPVLRYGREVKVLGGAGNVVRNLAALGADVTCVGVVGDDATGDEIVALMDGESRISHNLVRVPGRPTTQKTRYLAGGQQMVRVDREDARAVDGETESAIVAAVIDALKPGSALIIADYAKGVLTDNLLGKVITAAREKNAIVVVEPKSTNFARYAHAAVIIANAGEMAAATGLPCSTDAEAIEATRAAAKAGNFASAITTRSDKGMMALDETGVTHAFPAKALQVYDVSGAGDTVNAVAALMLAAGSTLAEAAYVANEAAGIVVGKLGTSVTSTSELKDALRVDDGVNFSDKIADLDTMTARVASIRRSGRSVGFTNGCFDILHAGHLSLLSQARAACDYLVVGLNSDASVKRLKGPERPVNGEHDRALLLAALELVDGVVLFGEDTPLETIKALTPEVLVKGADYKREDVVGGDIVEAAGGRVVLANLLSGRSTTGIIARIGGETSAS